MQNVTMGKVRVGLGSSWPHHFFRFWKGEGTTGALRELASCEKLLKNLVGTVGLVVCLCYDDV